MRPGLVNLGLAKPKTQDGLIFNGILEVNLNLFAIPTFSDDCDDENVEEHTLQSETVTKFLMFMDPENDKHVDHVFNRYINILDQKILHDNTS